jgi:hypothetical protein
VRCQSTRRLKRVFGIEIDSCERCAQVIAPIYCKLRFPPPWNRSSRPRCVRMRPGTTHVGLRAAEFFCDSYP